MQPVMKDLIINESSLPVISQLAESIPGGFFIYHADGDMKLIYCNSHMAEIFGCKNVEEFRALVHDSFRGIVHPEDFALVDASINKQIAQSDGAIDTVQYRIIRKDGKIGILRDCGRFSRSETYGDIYYVFVEDITENSESEDLHAVISALSEQYEVLLHMDFLSGKVDFYGTSEWVDKSLLGTFAKLSYEEKISYMAKKYVYEEDRQYFCEALEAETAIAQVLSEIPLVLRYRMQHKGKLQWYELKAVHHKEHIGRKCAMVGIRNVQQEMEQQERINAMLYKNNQHLLAFHEIIHSGMWNINLDENYEITQVNWSDEYRHLLGYTNAQDFPNVLSAWYEKVHPEDKEQAIDAFWKGARQEAPFDTDFRVLNKNGSYRWYHAAGRVETNTDDGYSYFGIFVDSTVEHENQLYQQAQKQDLDIIEILASEYSSVYYIDMRTDSLKPYTMNAETESEFGQIFNSGISYSAAFAMYVDKLILPEDREMMLREGSVSNILRKLANQKTFITHYRSSDNRFNEMKFVKVGNENEEPVAVALGFADKDEQVREELAAKRYSEIANALSEKYDSIYYVNIKDDTYVHFHSRSSNVKALLQEKGKDFFAECAENIQDIVYPADRNLVLGFLQKENLLQVLQGGAAELVEYRLLIHGKVTYYSMRAIRSSQDNEHIIVAVDNVDETVHQRQEEQAKLQQNYQIIEILASEYTSVYHIDMVTDALTPYSMNAETESKFGSVFRSGIAYTEAFKLYVEGQVLEEDRDMMLKAGSPENIRQQLLLQKTFVITYRSAENRYCEMKFVKVGADNEAPKAVALGFADKDEVYRGQKELEIEQQRYNAVVKVLSAEYSSIYYADIEQDLLMPYGNSQRIQGKFGKNAFANMTYSQATEAYIMNACSEKDREELRKNLSRDYMKSQLANKQYYTFIYQNDKEQYCELKCVRANESGNVSNVVVGFGVKDEEIRTRIQEEQERQRNFDIIEILASEYSSVYYIDLTTDGLETYTMNEDTESAFGKIFRSGIAYSNAYKMYVQQLILPADREMMMVAGSRGNIMKELRSKKTFLTTYRNVDGHYCEMKFVKVGNDEGVPTAVALGFADKDEELRSREEEQKKLQRNIDIIEILASEYTSVYYIDMMSEELDPYTMNEKTETEFGSIFRSGILYTDAFKMYVSTLVYKDDREMMLKAGSIYNILRELSNKKTFLTTYRNAEGHYCEMKFVKVGDEENPRAVALGFADKDAEIRAEMERKEISERDAAVISGLSDDFGCVVYASYEDFSEVHYRYDKMFEKSIPGWDTIKDFKERLDVLSGTIMHPEDRKAFYDATRPDVVKRMVEVNHAYFVNFRTLIDGKTTYYQLKFVRDERHGDTNVIAGFHNVDAETRREMEALEKAESASKAKTAFLFNMSHDIRTPMNAIIGFTNMAIKDIENPAKATESLEKVCLSSNMLLSLINDILDMSRIESGKVKLNETKRNVTASFKTIMPVMSDLAKRKNIDISFTVHDVADEYILADTSRTERVLVNLISNAIKYTQDGGQVRVSLTQGEKNSDGKCVYLYEIADNGVGMSEEFQKHMFEEFSREETTTNSGVQGTGLGLPLANKLVELMGGRITCVSKQGVGSTFTVELPFALQTEAQRQEEEKKQSQGTVINDLTEKRVLLAEDNELNREIAVDILEEKGMIVETAVNGKEALEMMLEHGEEYYDVVLMDIQMPIMDGYQATAAIRNAMPNLRIPIIALSANAFEEDRQRSREAGMDDHIAKPINVEVLMQTLQKSV